MKKYFVLALASCSFVTMAGDKILDCDNAQNTLEINNCASIELGYAEAELNEYLKASFEHNANDPTLIESMKIAQKDWQAYMSSHCSSVYTQWRDGTIRGVMSISCKAKLTKQRTHEIWSNFLTYMDSTPPVLPDPNELKKEPQKSTTEAVSSDKTDQLKDLHMLVSSKVCAVEWSGKFVGIERFNSSNGFFEAQDELLKTMTLEEFNFHTKSFQKDILEDRFDTYEFCVNWNNTILKR